jgi:hypothetical protein
LQRIKKKHVGIGEGDCNSGDHTTCSGDLKCGVNNCLSEFGFGDSSADCCILTGIHDNAANIANNAAAINSNDADILSISNDVSSNTQQIQQLGGNCNFIFKQALPNISIGSLKKIFLAGGAFMVINIEGD